MAFETEDFFDDFGGEAVLLDLGDADFFDGDIDFLGVFLITNLLGDLLFVFDYFTDLIGDVLEDFLGVTCCSSTCMSTSSSP